MKESSRRQSVLTKNLSLESSRRYYRALIGFIKGDYAGSLEELNWNRFGIEQYYPKICQLKMLNLLKTERMAHFEWETRICMSNLIPSARNGAVWIQSLHDMMFDRADLLNPFQLGRGSLEIWFKAGMYLQKDDLLEKIFLQLENPVEEDVHLQEMFALHHYRQGRYEKAFENAYKLKGVNARNILGRIQMAGDNFKLAWKHFNEAVALRRDSLNALEYLPMLAWILGHWQEGKKFLIDLARIRKLESDEVALLAAFYIQARDYESARKVLVFLEKRFHKVLPLEGLLMGSYIFLKLKKSDEMVPYALRSCLLSEGINCWLLLQRLGWNDFEGLVDRDELIFSEEGPDIDQYRNPVEIAPLQETIFVLSKDIKELDRLDADNNDFRVEGIGSEIGGEGNPDSS